CARESSCSARGRPSTSGSTATLRTVASSRCTTWEHERAMTDSELASLVSAAFTDRALLKVQQHADAVRETLARLDAGALRVAQKGVTGWTVNAWVKEAILLYFALQPMAVMELKPFEFHDKVPLKKGLEAAGVRVVPPGTVRYGAFLEKG